MRQYMRELFMRMRLGAILKLRYFRARAHRDSDYKKPPSNLSFPPALFSFLSKNTRRSLNESRRVEGHINFETILNTFDSSSEKSSFRFKYKKKILNNDFI